MKFCQLYHNKQKSILPKKKLRKQKKKLRKQKKKKKLRKQKKKLRRPKKLKLTLILLLERLSNSLKLLLLFQWLSEQKKNHVQSKQNIQKINFYLIYLQVKYVLIGFLINCLINFQKNKRFFFFNLYQLQINKQFPLVNSIESKLIKNFEKQKFVLKND
ncbi:transmembrane protein, putative (macronuclear) [Tetrahymena thermophila SB210]|uniref:Transmembrane protein, putative n=1 Tax=Tetrahymena thermophila (strain SB210) TaxID=312017 RepID=W7XB03_TETTS|nr:transmembrane protein, putative [Tetrahymena thermophila SB210]EWS74527.1 transmembrane protein, putative [Tetrahymena thermophila SB210]|eukprot:XP_012652957.1 transmembrane protein, putative [Tetrahymena thermophila SB210]